MITFNDLIEIYELLGVAIKDAHFTWTNCQPELILCKVDRFLISSFLMRFA